MSGDAAAAGLAGLLSHAVTRHEFERNMSVMKFSAIRYLPAAAAFLVLAGCVANPPKEEAKPMQEAPVAEKKEAGKKTAAPAPAPAAATAKKAPAPVAAADKGGYNLSKNKPVTDSTKVESGQGTMVKGINDWEGEVTGVPGPKSRFTRLRIGMSQQQVVDLAGQPTDQGAYVTGKAFIPFYFGSDRSRWEMVYKGQGRLIFSNQSGFGSGYYLTWIIHNANEGGYR